MSQVKNCKICEKKFEVSDSDLEFYQKMSPTFAGKVFDIPTPKLCPECRTKRRLLFRNDFNIYKRKSSMSGKDILAVYSPMNNNTVYSNDEWWSDKWDPLEFGQEYDSSRSFFDQFAELHGKVPRLNLYVDNLCEGCEFTNQISDSKDCYLVSSTFQAERSMYCFRLIKTKDSLDCIFATNCELCYEAIDANNCNNCKYIQECANCSNSQFLFDCQSCSNCIMCQGLRNKTFYYKNKPITESEFKELESRLDSCGRSETDNLKREFSDFRKLLPVRFARLVNTENVTGHNVKNGKDAKSLFDADNIQNCSYGININDSKDCFDVNFAAENATLNLEVLCTGVNANYILFSADTWPYVANLFYCDTCSNNAKDCFGCIGLRHRQHCILNKQYSKDEYEKKVAQIIEKMIADGEWGEFFPYSLSPFAYNESMAMNYFPITKSEAQNLGASWLDEDYSPNYDGSTYSPKENIRDYLDESERNMILSGIIKCEVSGKPFKILAKELAYYIRNNIPIPTKHFSVRIAERFALRSPRKLWHRKCMNKDCKNEFETTYSPERPEIVYCEECYQKVVI